jgi:hypothetical protein
MLAQGVIDHTGKKGRKRWLQGSTLETADRKGTRENRQERCGQHDSRADRKVLTS